MYVKLELPVQYLIIYTTDRMKNIYLIVLIGLIVIFSAVYAAGNITALNGSLENLINPIPVIRCGTNLPACVSPLRCGNGFCISQETTMPIESAPLPVLPR